MSKRSKVAIKNALVKLLKEKKYNEITISQICDEALVVRKTFYNNFKSKADVVDFTSLSLVEEYMKFVHARKDYTYKAMSKQFFDFAYTNRDVFETLKKAEFLHLIVRDTTIAIPNLAMHIPNSTLADADKKLLEYTLAIHVVGIMKLYELWMSDGYQQTSEELSHIYTEIFKDLQY